MEYQLKLQSVSDDELLERLSELLQDSRRVETDLVAHIGEVDARKLYAKKASSSMFSYCTERLHLSEHEAYLRIHVARASRKHPILLDMLGDGRLHLSGIAKLAPHLTEANREKLLARATHKSKQKIEELVAEFSPKPDVRASMRKLPTRREETKTTPVSQLGLDRVAKPTSAPAPSKPAKVEPSAPARYRIQFTANDELRDKLERLRTLMSASVPDGDIGAIIAEAITEKLERLEAKRFGKANAPRKGLEETDTSPTSRHIPAAVKRAVCERDQNQCAFVGDDGRRCSERGRLEFHHRVPFGRGGDHSVENIQLVCRTHNAYLAELDYGKDVIERYKKTGLSPSRVSEPAPVYFIPRHPAGFHRWSTRPT